MRAEGAGRAKTSACLGGLEGEEGGGGREGYKEMPLATCLRDTRGHGEPREVFEPGMTWSVLFIYLLELALVALREAGRRRRERGGLWVEWG